MPKNKHKIAIYAKMQKILIQKTKQNRHSCALNGDFSGQKQGFFVHFIGFVACI